MLTGQTNWQACMAWLEYLRELEEDEEEQEQHQILYRYNPQSA